jgi:hypothetical protein
VREGVIDEDERTRIDEQAIARVDAAVEFADASPFPTPESLYDDVYVLDQEVRGWYSVQTTDVADGAIPNGAPSAANDEISQQLTHALAAGEDARESAAAVDPETGVSPSAAGDPEAAA